jgi:hypothetical protein
LLAKLQAGYDGWVLAAHTGVGGLLPAHLAGRGSAETAVRTG